MLFCTVAAQTVPGNFKFSENGKPGDPLKTCGSGLDKVTSVTLERSRDGASATKPRRIYRLSFDTRDRPRVCAPISEPKCLVGLY